MSQSLPTAATLRAAVAALVEEDPDELHDDTNLIELGLDSIMLMQLVAEWRRAGLAITVTELSQNPTLGAWEGVLLAAEAAEAPVPAPVRATRSSSAAERPLGPMQHAYWVGRTEGQHLGGVAAHLYTEFDGAGVDPDALAVALTRLVRRHDMLRLRVTPDGRQSVGPLPERVAPTVHDLRDRSTEDVAAELAAIRDRLSHQVLDIEAGEVFSVALSLLPGGRTRLHLDVDMVAADAVSYRMLLAELATDRELPAPGYDYGSYLADRAAVARRDGDREYWERRLPDLPGAPALPTVAVPAGTAPWVARRHVLLPPERRSALAAAAARHGLTTAAAVATAFAETVGRWSSGPRFLLNVPLFDREPLHPAVDEVVGDFSSSVLLEIDLSESASFLDRARAVQRRLHADASHAGHSGLDVLRDLTRRDGERALATVVFTSALSLGDLFAPAVIATFGEPVWIISQGPQVLLDAQITELGGGMLVNWDTREEMFAPGVLDAMFTAFHTLLERLAQAEGAWELPAPATLGAGRPVATGGRAVDRRVIDGHGHDRPDGVLGAVLDSHGAPTGELGIRGADGTVTVRGLLAEQVVVRGVAVLPVDVEEALLADARVAAAVAVLRPGRPPAALIVAAAGDVSVESIRSDLRRRAPGHLVPDELRLVAALPERGAALALLDAAAPESAAVAPRTALEQVIARVWAEVLPVPEFGVTDRFVSLGGDSVLAASVVSRLRETLDTDVVTVRALFTGETVAGLAGLTIDAGGPQLEDLAHVVLELMEEIDGLSDEDVAAALGSDR
ncbi:phosphopantetheine-binding protein [Pseudonocardia sp. GCM10023141]|uniref:phosphopantetheine-binding protein n=1 Tax=Pseudonocardia sp. GCM10023141 TaxID=3252653 RepID=UPI00360F4772